MKKFRSLLLSLISILSTVFFVYSQNAPVTTISSATANPGTIITLQVSQANVVTLGGLGLKLDYDATVLSYVNPNPTSQSGNWHNTNSALYSAGGDIVGVQTDDIAGFTKRLVFYWTTSSTATTPVTSGGIAVICDLQFRYYGGNTTVIFDNSSSGGQNCEYADAAANPYIDIPTASYYINGTVSPASSTATLLPDSVDANPANICPGGGSSTISLYGGTLASGDIWTWYSGSCGGTYIATGTSILPYITSATTYFLRAEGATSTTNCLTVTVNMYTASILASSASANPSSLCLGNPTTLTVTGGTLGSGAYWRWYSGSCGGQNSSATITPTATTTYYVRAEGICNTTSCLPVTVTVSSNPVNAFFNYNNTGGTTAIQFIDSSSATNGNTITSWSWNFGDGNTSTLQNPTNTYANTGYYAVCLTATGSNGCPGTYCDSITVCNSSSASVAPTSITASPAIICSNSYSTVSITGGTLGMGAYWHCYAGSCGGAGGYITSANFIQLGATTTTTYYIRAEGSCNTTSCISITINVIPNTTSAYFNYNFSGNNSTYQFIDSSTTASNNTIISWNWNFGDGHTSLTQYPSHLFVSSGTYVISLTVTDTLGCSDVNYDSVFVTTNSINCNLYLTYTTIDETTTGASDGSIDLTVNSGLTPYTYTWSNSASVEDISGLTMGYYDITVTDSIGCATFASIYVDDLSTSNTPIATLSNIPQDTCLAFNYDSVYVYSVNTINTTTINVVWAFLQTSNGTIAYLSEVYNVTNQGFYNISISVTCNSKSTDIYYGLIYINNSNLPLIVSNSKLILNSAEVYPNPFDNNININLNVQDNSKIRLQLLNILGQEILNNNYNVSAGLNKIQVNTEKLNSGIYFIRIDSGNNNVLNKMIVK